MNKYLTDFARVISDCKFTNTYKMAWAKAIIDLSILESQLQFDRHGRVRFSLHQIAERFFHYYWNQTIFFDLVQGSNPSKPPTMISEVKVLIDTYQKVSNNYFPIVCAKVDFVSLGLEKEVQDLLKVYIRTLKRDVAHRFTNLSSDSPKYLYILEDDAVTFSPDHIFMFRENHSFLFQAINYRWSQMLENFNLSPKISSKVRAIHAGEPVRKSLHKWKQYLDLVEDETPKCFYCSTYVIDDLSIDHVIPWSFMYSDDLWNLVYSHRACNSQKSNHIPSRLQIEALKERNIKLYEVLKLHLPKSNVTEELKVSIERDYVMKFWLACKG